MTVRDIILQECDADYEHGSTEDQAVSRAADLWAMEGGVGWLWIYLDEVSSECPSMLVACAKPHGYFLSVFEVEYGGTVNLVARGDAESASVVPMDVGDWELSVPASFFVDGGVAAGAIRHFCRTGLHVPYARWVPYEDIQDEFYS